MAGLGDELEEVVTICQRMDGTGSSDGYFKAQIRLHMRKALGRGEVPVESPASWGG